MLNGSQLERDINKSNEPSKLAQIICQFKEWRNEKAFFDDYFTNCIKILLGYEPVDYKVVSHNNLIVHWTEKNPQNNILVNSKIYNFETGRYE